MTTNTYQGSQFYTEFKSEIDKLYQFSRDPLHNKLYFTHCVTLMEKYLSDLSIVEVESNKEYLVRVASLNKYKDLQLKVSYLIGNSLEDYIINSLKKTLWHRLNDAAVLYKHVFDINFNLSRNLIGFTEIRHHIVHRNGFDLAGHLIEITDDKLTECLNDVELFIKDIDKKYQKIKTLG